MMELENLIIEQTPKTPQIDLNQLTGDLIFSGKSIPENAAKIFKVLIRINEPDYVLIVHLYLPIDEFDKMNDFEDIIDAFVPIEDIVHSAISSIGIKLHGIDNKGAIIKETIVFI